MGTSIGLIQAAALIGLGVILESPEKRKVVINTLDNLGLSVKNMISNTVNKGGAIEHEPISAEDNDV